MFSFSSFAMSDTTDCPNMNINKFFVEGKRDDAYVLESKLVVVFHEACDGKTIVYADLNNPAYPGFLSVVLSAKAMNQSVNIAVNSNNAITNANELAYIGF